MSASRKKISIIFCGGSLISVRNKTGVFCVASEHDIQSWLSEIPELGLIAEISPKFIAGEDARFDLSTVESCVSGVEQALEECDGFVVLVRAEHMIESAVFAEFMLQGLGKPIIFTGSRYSPSSIIQKDIKQLIKQGGLGLRSNVINAVQVSTDHDFPATAIMFGNKIIKPTKVARASFQSMNLFTSLDDDYLGRVDFGVSLHRGKVIKRPFHVYRELSKDVVVVDTSLLESVVQEYHTAASGQKKVKKAIIVHLRENEVVDKATVNLLIRQFNSVIFFNENIIIPHDGVVCLTGLTWPTAVAKTIWAHGNTPSKRDFELTMTSDVIGELLVK